MTMRSLLRRIKRHVGPHVFRLAQGGWIAAPLRLLLRGYGFQPASAMLSIEAAAQHSIQLAPPAESTIVAPCQPGEAPRILQRPAPALHAHILQDVVTSPYSPGCVSGTRLLLPDTLLDTRAQVRTDSARLFQYDAAGAYLKTVAPRSIPAALHIGGAGAFNWYHFLVECLPKALLAEQLPEEFHGIPLLVPAEALRIPTFATALDCFRDGRPVIALERQHYARVDRLLVFDDVSYGPFNLAKGLWPMINHYHQHDAFLRHFAAELRQRIGQPAEASPTSKRIFLIRPGIRRDYNQQELLEIALRYGFEPLTPETLSLEQQAEVFSTAQAIVGASGAAWVGMLFCKQPAQCLSWLVPEYMQFSSYSSLAHLLGHSMTFLATPSEQPLQNTDAAYLASYHVDPTAFEAALQAMLRESQ